MNTERRRLIASAVLCAAGARMPALASGDPWRVLQGGGCAVLLRHGRTVPGIGDPPGFRLDDCSTQRNLSDEGRAESRRLGEEFARRGVRVDEVLTSRWCRCVDTARLAFPRHEVRVFEPLNSFFADGSTRDAQTSRLREYLAGQAADRRIVMVTHQVNIAALAGESVAMGEALVVRLGAYRPGEVLARLRPA